MASTKSLDPSKGGYDGEKKLRVLLAKLGLDVHDRGVLTIVRHLVDSGMEVIYIGNALPDQIVKVAIEEDVDVVGVSSLGGAHLSLGARLIEVAKQQRARHSLRILIGGIFSPRDIPQLKRLGFDGVFGPGTTGNEIVSHIRKLAANELSFHL